MMVTPAWLYKLTSSSITVPRSPDVLKRHGITHVLSLTSSRDCPTLQEELGIEHLHVKLDDNPFEDIIMCLEALRFWISHSLNVKRGGGEGDAESKVLVHCILGQSRSGAVIVAFLMYNLSLDYNQALATAQKYRPSILPNSGFADQIRLWQGLGYSILKNGGEGEDGRWETKPEYEEWKANRGILMTKKQQEMQNELMSNMVGMVRRYNK